MPTSLVSIVSKTIIQPNQKSMIKPLKLSVSDLPMLSCQYIQKGILLARPPLASDDLISLLETTLSETLSHFPPLAGRLSTDPSGHVHIMCNDSGVDFVHARAMRLYLDHIMVKNQDVDPCFKELFMYDNMLSYKGHFNPLVAVQVTELGDGVFIGCTVNHAVTDGTSFWNFFNVFAEVSRGATKKISKLPNFTRETILNSSVVLKLPDGGPSATFSGDEPLREKIFHFSRQSIVKLKLEANSKNLTLDNRIIESGKNEGIDVKYEISSFQSLCAQLWRSVTRARNLDGSKKTTFRMAINCRHRLEPRLEPLYFGNAIQSIPTVELVGEVLSRDLRWCAKLLNHNVAVHDDSMVRQGVKDWESNPRLFPLGNFDGAMITMGSSTRFPMYDNDFGWGKPLAIRSGKANKFDGKISAFPGREGGGSIDLEVVLLPATMAKLERDLEFMQYVS